MPDLSPFLQTALGGLMTMGGGAIAHWLTQRREREARRHEAEERRHRQQAEFQIKTLTDLQEALARVMKSVYPLADIDYHDTFNNVARDKKKARRLWLTWQDAYAASTIYAARVQDAEIRQAVGEVLQIAQSLATPIRRRVGDPDQGRETAEDDRENLMPAFERLNQRIGEQLRALY